MKTIAILSVLLLLGASAQEPSIEQDWSRIQRQLDATPQTESEVSLDRGQRIALLQAFIQRWQSEGDPGRPELLGARSRLGSLHLAGLESAHALTQFAAILIAAPDAALDARGRALYGKAQALLLLNRIKPAKDALKELRDGMVGTRWAAHAVIALKHLADDDSDRARVGHPAPAIDTRLDRLGKARSPASLHGKPVLLLFLSPFDDGGIDTAARWIDRARRAGLPSEQILIFGVSAEAQELTDLVAKRGLEGILFPTPAGFLDPDLLHYRVRSLPSSALIGPDDILLAENLPPGRLRQVIEELLR